MATKSRKRSNAEAKRLAAERAARKARNQWIALIAVGVAIIGGFIAYSIIDALPEDGDTSVAGWDLPALANDPNGDGRLTLGEFAGQPLVVNFYADWCTACEAELPAFSAIADEFDGRVRFVHVNSQETGDWRRMPRQFHTDDWPIARDINGSTGNGSGLHDSLGGRGMPITAFYDTRGRLLDVNNGAMDEPGLRAALSSLYGVS